jgi:predicted kinase
VLIVITGPPAAGKSTVARELAKAISRSADLPFDTINHFIVGGHLPPWDASNAGIAQAHLNADVSSDIVERYQAAGYTVILDGVFFPPEIQRLRDRHGDLTAVLLLPNIDVLRRRDRERPTGQRMGDRVNTVHAEFLAVLEDFPGAILDTSEHEPQRTVEAVLRITASRLA